MEHFSDAVYTNGEPSKKATPIGKQVLVDNSVVFTYDSEETMSYESVNTLTDVIALQEAKPNVLLGIKPKLYSAFIDTNGLINPYVKVGQKVKYINDSKADIEGNPPRLVSAVYFKSLSDMSVIIAEFEEGDFALTNLLTIVDED